MMVEEKKGILDTRIPLIISIPILLCFIGIFYYLFKKYEFRFHEILKLPFDILLIMSALVLTHFLIHGLIISNLVRIFNVKLSFYEWYGLAILRKYVNYLPVKGGIIAKGLYLKKCHDLPVPHFISIIGGFIVLFFLSNGILGLVCWIMAGKYHTNVEIVIPFFFAAFIAVGILLISYSPDFSTKKSYFFASLDKVYEGWRLIRKNRIVVTAIIALSMMLSIFYALRLLILFRWQSVQISFLQALMVSVLTLVSIFINITPSALGVKEAVLIYTSNLMGVEVSLALYVAAVDRLISFVFVFMLGPLFSYIFGKKAGLTVFRKPKIDTLKV